VAEYIRPSWLVRRVINPLVSLVGGATTLAVRGRRSGEWKTVPVNVLELDGARYLVAIRGECEWVRNLRAQPTGELRRRSRREPFRAAELPEADRPRLIRAYRDRWDRQVRQFFEQLPEPADHAVFRIEPA
jgi:deazaflavin-dependent oxidoreductase (nitroreductase family)